MGCPMWQPLSLIIGQLDSSFPTLVELNSLLASRQPPVLTKSGYTVSLVEQEYGALPFERQYEPRCYLSGEVPTRSHNWHDLLNALVWLTFPRAKATINARHYHELSHAQASPAGRGRVRDMNTLLDESGVLVPCANEEMAELLRTFQWDVLFWQRRDELNANMGFYLFGHGLYEKALRPYVGLTGQGLLLPVPPEFFNWTLPQRLECLDAVLADYLDSPENCLSTRELTPVPLLGIPGWAAESESRAFYENEQYFRKGRRVKA